MARRLEAKDIEKYCDALLAVKIQSGFARELGMSEEAFRNSYRDAVEGLKKQGVFKQGIPALVEERIPLTRQAELLRIGIDPGIFYKVVHHPDRQPYGVWLKVISPDEAFVPGIDSVAKAVAKLPVGLRPTTPFEGIGAEVRAILDRSFVAMSAGDYEMPGILTGGSTRFDSLCLESYLGRPRISHVRFDKHDPLIGILAARK